MHLHVSMCPFVQLLANMPTKQGRINEETKKLQLQKMANTHWNILLDLNFQALSPGYFNYEKHTKKSVKLTLEMMQQVLREYKGVMTRNIKDHVHMQPQARMCYLQQSQHKIHKSRILFVIQHSKEF